MSIFLRLKGFTSKHRPLTVLLYLVLVLALFFVVKGWIDAPRDLGAKLIYIGKSDYGNIFGFDQYPGSTYYFATDMNTEELKTYFKKATYFPVPSDGGGSDSGYSYTNFHFQLESRNTGGFVLAYYGNANAQAVEQQFNLTNNTNLHYIVSIDASEYQHAKESL